MDLLKKLSLRMKLMLGFGVLNILIIVTSGFAVINTSNNIDASYNIERILGKSYTRVMNTQRALDAAIAAMDSPLLETSVKGAKGLIVNVTGGMDLGLSEVSTAVGYIKEFLDPEANIIFGTIVDERIHDAIMVTVIATGIEENADAKVIKYNI